MSSRWITRTAAAVACALAAWALSPADATQPAEAAQPNPDDSLEARFENPRPGSDPVMLWFWNGPITEDLIDRQLADMRAEGISEVVIFPEPRGGLTPTFFTEGWFEVVEHALREAERTGMKVWLFNDDQFSSGRTGGLVVGGGTVGDRVYEPHPEMRAKSLANSVVSVRDGETIQVRDEFPGLVPTEFSVVDGRLLVEGGNVHLLNRGTDWQDYTFRADVRPLQTATLRGVRYAQAGWLVRASDESNGYMFLLSNYPRSGLGGGVLTRINVVDGRNTGTTHIDLPFDVQDGQSYSVQTQVDGDTITTTIDGVQVDQFTDDSHSQGTIGFRESTNQNESATFDNVQVSDSSGNSLYSQDFSSQSSLGDFGTAVPEEQVVGVAAIPVVNGQRDVASAVDLSEEFAADGAWTAEGGDYAVEYYSYEYQALNGPNYINVFDDKAVARYIEIIHEEYYRRYSGALESGLVRGMWDDEPRLASGLVDAPPWSDLIGQKLDHTDAGRVRLLASIFSEPSADNAVRVREFWHAAGDALAESYYQQQGAWGEKRGIPLISQPLGDHQAPHRVFRAVGEVFKNHQWFQIPGGDAIKGRDAAPGLRSLVPRYATSAGHQNGSQRILHENLGAFGWAVNPQMSRYVNGFTAMRGVNLTVLHAYWSNYDEVRNPPPYQPQSPWWSELDGLVDWTGRINELTRGQAAGSTALLNPMSSVEGWQYTPEGAQADTAFREVAYAMEDRQVDYDIVDENALLRDPGLLNHARVRDGGILQIGQMSYRTVVLPPSPALGLESVQLLQDFVDEGGRVIVYGTPASHEADGRDTDLQRAFQGLLRSAHVTTVGTTPELQQALDITPGARAVTLREENSGVRAYRVRHGRTMVYLVFNEGEETVSTTATFPEASVPELWDPEDGSHEVAPQFQHQSGEEEVSLNLVLDPAEVTAVVFRGNPGDLETTPRLADPPVQVESVTKTDDGALQAEVIVDEPTSTSLEGAVGPRRFTGELEVSRPFEAIALGGIWQTRFDESDNDWVERPLGSWTEIDPDYSGSVTYQRNVELQADDLAAGHMWVLDLGDVRETAKIRVNGVDVGRLLWPPYRLDVTDALKPGSNQIAVTVANTAANEHGESVDSGLLGPVSLDPLQAVTVRLER